MLIFNNFVYQVLSIQQMLNNVGLHFNINLKAQNVPLWPSKTLLKAQNVPLWPTKTSLKSPKRATLATKNIISFKLTFL
jgi:hypothetical protein